MASTLSITVGSSIMDTGDDASENTDCEYGEQMSLDLTLSVGDPVRGKVWQDGEWRVEEAFGENG